MTEIQRAIDVLFETGTATEVRVPKSQQYGTISGYFNDFSKMASEIEELSGSHAGIYYVMNPVAPALLARAYNEIHSRAAATTTDEQVTRRRWLLIDVDAQRPAGISSSDLEKMLSQEIASEVYAWLTAQGWPDPVTADSGNGYHLLYRIDLENTKENATLVQGVLKTLAMKFDTDRVKVDRSVFNAARITKAYGTMVKKGQNIPDRPHRQSCLRKVPEPVLVVSTEHLKAVAAMSALLVKVPPPQPQFSGASTPITVEKIEEFLDFYGIEFGDAEQRPNGTRWILNVCPFNPEHANGEVAVFLHNDGGLGFQCFHNSCQDHGWKTFRAHLEETQNKKFWFRDNVPPVTPPSAKTPATLKVVRGTDVKPEKIEWLWDGKIAIGKLTLFAGHPGIGKGLATMDIAARITTGQPWADSANKIPASDVLIVSSEDAINDTLVPRLMAVGADISKCSFIEATTDITGERIFALDTDLPQLQQHLEQNPEIRLVVIDPIANHLGAINSNREQEVRKVLTPLGALAAKFKVAIVIVSHFNKKIDMEVVQRVGGAMAMTGCVRMAWAFSQSKDDENLRVMYPIKANVSKSTEGLRYDIDVAEVVINGEPVEVARIFWCGESSESATHTLTVTNGKKKKDEPQPSTYTDSALKWLANYLGDGEPHKRSDAVKAAQDQQVCSAPTLDRAWKHLMPGAKKDAPFGAWQLCEPKTFAGVL
jgi:hypothetical protein